MKLTNEEKVIFFTLCKCIRRKQEKDKRVGLEPTSFIDALIPDINLEAQTVFEGTSPAYFTWGTRDTYRTLHKLEEKGLVEFGHKSGFKGRRVHLTEQGVKLVDQIRTNRRQHK